MANETKPRGSEDGWARIEDLFHRALELPAQEREAFLRMAAGDDRQLYEEAISLVRSAEREGSFLVPPSERPAPPAATRGWIGQRLGPWRVLELIGEGGMGHVFLVERADGLYEQKAALKIIHREMAAGSALRRFEEERRVLARLEHPAIARLLDGGATDDGLPYLVVELVDGLPVDEYCDHHKTSTRGRLELFRKICEAVGYAHRNLVVHRDLKPANILVTHGGEPKLLDFGIAKLLDPAGASVTLTVTPALTPGYASPEQIRGETVTTASDVFSLGVVLYELLTERPPFPRDTGSLVELARLVCEVEPPAPSAAAPGRREELRGDLDHIVMRALAKEPSRRYTSVEALAEDVRRHLDGLPVLARPDTLRYRTWKLVRRNRALFAGLAATAIALIAGIVGVAHQANVAQERLGDVLRLSDARRLRQLKAEVALPTLQQAKPAHLPVFDGWLERAKALRDSLPAHRALLASLRERAKPYDEDARARDRESHTRSSELRWLQEMLDVATLPDREFVQSRAAKVESEVSGRRSWDMATDEDQWEHDTLTELVEALERFVDPKTGELAAVESRRAFASEVVAKTIEAHSSRWQETITSLREREGLEMEPQVGLVPLWRDEESGLLEFAHLETGEIPERGEDGKLTFSDKTGLVFVLIPGGTIAPGDSSVAASSRPGAEARLDPYFISKYEMTQAQWQRITGSNPSIYYPGRGVGATRPGLTNPVEHVSWDMARNTMLRLGLALPTEAQWEMAARGGTTTRFWTGGDVASLQGAENLADSSAKRLGAPWTEFERSLDDGYLVHAPVFSMKPNPFGLHHALGNVLEWCQDRFGTLHDPMRAGTGERYTAEANFRMVRGGSFVNNAVWADPTHRSNTSPDLKLNNLGVRPARSIEGVWRRVP